MKNPEIAAAFEQIADILEFQGANAFRVRAYRNAARIIHELSEPIARIVGHPERKLTEFSGIGADLAEKITALVTTGGLPVLEELRAQAPERRLSLRRRAGAVANEAA